MKLFNDKIGYFDVIVFIILIYLFYNFTFTIQTDIQLHAQFIKDYAYGNKPFQVNFLYYFAVYFLTFFSSKSSALLVMSVYVLTSATFAKYYIVKRIFLKNIPNVSIKTATISSFLLLFCFSLPVLYFVLDYFYLLNFPPNVWHNSTTIFVMPFVLLLFWISNKQLDSPSKNNLYIICLLIILNALIKPSFLFVYLPIYPLLLLKTYTFFKKVFWINLIPIFIACLLIFGEYYLIYLGKNNTQESSVTVDFFYFYKNWSKGFNVILALFIALLSSLLFPIITIIKNKQLLHNKMIQFSALAVLLSIIISISVRETGVRENDGNFLWQTFMCVFLLFFSCLYQLMILINKSNNNWKKYLPELIIFGIHFISGIAYLLNIFITNNYF
ncbi:hypothetical protein [Flavobacterium aquatile]|uniref:Beta-carotene 15,15'-monooxygenase n=1 Tax=Flavobacterium aquatile LMG 4008 = ATCC 11947 TaxID=1453498 RepID=A0A095SWN6_9FLAO|nr:hypothetical protein [Flavobacterium aquatile]KGD68774.1 hypothetical protein LG45_03775 [Flavobacterium aquatile LMG 4008 = ATCC 11947]OXA69194.1 hypothetical protein B0A61_01405 [Flavobacterium aquatile LMG 4008 = ATCC 11947]GEC79055.1 hypothetical protein FAQ01_19250 [Flavobacterium aquatile]